MGGTFNSGTVSFGKTMVCKELIWYGIGAEIGPALWERKFFLVQLLIYGLVQRCSVLYIRNYGNFLLCSRCL